ncbi:uncharacterized protein SCHCODRAFT_02601906 [Schizophyllum commune H4-8]|uniref:uncharacterized protein n=1 Tax=Schizophyllum commune (strain H4-8 / FGSC 9210) TaxID=578458 RepID=UPI00216003D2|nr:uncharacterized protein SCHCODRAFT_02601906 [Schizophyllum commune H4-8]KAI5888343.1 hypothetical protein SCHCODRAFT_02601906 [Schizophyllum commune H4-8]
MASAQRVCFSRSFCNSNSFAKALVALIVNEIQTNISDPPASSPFKRHNDCLPEVADVTTRGTVTPIPYRTNTTAAAPFDDGCGTDRTTPSPESTLTCHEDGRVNESIDDASDCRAARDLAPGRTALAAALSSSSLEISLHRESASPCMVSHAVDEFPTPNLAHAAVSHDRYYIPSHSQRSERPAARVCSGIVPVVVRSVIQTEWSALRNSSDSGKAAPGPVARHSKTVNEDLTSARAALAVHASDRLDGWVEGGGGHSKTHEGGGGGSGPSLSYYIWGHIALTQPRLSKSGGGD